MFPNSQLMGVDANFPDVALPYKSINNYAKKYPIDQIRKNEPKFYSGLAGLEADIDTFEMKIQNYVATSRSNLKDCQSAKTKYAKQSTEMKVLEKRLEKHLSEALKAIKAADTKKIAAIAKKAVKDGAAYMKLLKSTADAAKNMSAKYENARAALAQAQAMGASLKASQTKVLLLAP